MIGIDTDVCIAILNGTLDERTLRDLIQQEEIGLSAQSVFELYRGVYKRKFGKNRVSDTRHQQDMEIINNFIQSFNQIPFNFKASQISSEIFERLKGDGEDIGPFDCQIAGSLIASGITRILTRNRKHYSKIKEISVIEI